MKITEINSHARVLTASANQTTKKGTYIYIFRRSKKDPGKRVKIKVVETNFTKKIPVASSKVLKKTNEKEYGEAGASWIQLKPKMTGTCIIGVEKVTDAALKSGKTYKLKLRIICANSYDNREIAVDKTNTRQDRKRMITVSVKIK